MYQGSLETVFHFSNDALSQRGHLESGEVCVSVRYTRGEISSLTCLEEVEYDELELETKESIVLGNLKGSDE